HWNLNEIFFSIIEAFLNSIRYLICLSKSMAYYTFFIANYYNSVETKSPATFNYFRNTVYVNQFFLKVKVSGSYIMFSSYFWHDNIFKSLIHLRGHLRQVL